MTMTTFRDTTPSTGNTRYVPEDLVTIDGQDIYDILPGYRQLDTAGRGIVPILAATSNTRGQDGDNIESTRLGSIELTVTYDIYVKGSTELRRAMSILSNFLVQDQQERTLTFADDDGYSYTRCLLSAAPAPYESGDHIMGYFTFTSYDAYAVKRMSSSGPISLTYASKIRPKFIKFSFNSAVENFTVANERDVSIQFANVYVPANRTITIAYTRERIRAYYMDGDTQVSLLYGITKYSALHAFYLYKGGAVGVGPTPASLTIEWEDTKL